MKRRILSWLLCLSLLLTLQPGIRAAETEGESLDFAPVELPGAALTLPGPELPVDGETEPLDTDLVRVIILMEEKSVLETDARAVYNAAARMRMEALRISQEQLLEDICRQLFPGSTLAADYHYTWLLNGIALAVPYGAIEKIEKLEGVRRVLQQQVYTVCETVTQEENPTFSGDDGIGREAAWARDYTGKGMKIAVIDTGLDSDHPSFAPLPEDLLTEHSAGEETVAAVLESLNAASRYPGLEPGQLYRSSKVAFGFNYCDNNTVIDHLDNMGSHGTHVAGVAAANRDPEPRAAGVAPDAQLYIMKVFGAGGGAYTQDILAAMEDALLLGADVINLSLGAPAGFSSGDRTAQGDSLDEFYDRIAATGTVLCVSAGNFRNSGYANRWGTNANLSLYPDDGTVGAPGTYANTLTVASAQNRTVSGYCLRAGVLTLPYNDCEAYGLPGLRSLTGEYPVVLIPGTGEAEHYEGVDAAGKIVLVERGGISFAQKHMAAEAAGAAAMLVYNNVQGALVMDMTGTQGTIPAASVSGQDGEALRAALEENSGLRISFPAEPMERPDPAGYQMSEFSARGPAPELKLTPDITAPGGNIYSAVDGGDYGFMSGTSMAAPALAGMAALVLQYLREEFPQEDKLVMTRNLLGSTARLLWYNPDQNLPCSPRSQGAGMANVFRAVEAECFLAVEGMDFPRAELGDDPEKTGAYGFRFQVRNISGSDAYYAPSLIVQGEGTIQTRGRTFLSGTPVLLEADTRTDSQNLVLTHDVDDSGSLDSRDARRIRDAAVSPEEEPYAFRYDVDQDQSVTSRDVQAMLEALVGNTDGEECRRTVLKVPAGETAQVEAEVLLSENAKTYLDTNFPNGGYVEGYAVLQPLSGGMELSLPYLGFYGSWAQAPVLDTGSYWELLNAPEGEVVGNQSVHLLFSGYEGKEKGIYPGMNPYVEDEPFAVEHICLSPNGDGNLDSLSDICLSLLRNAASLHLRITNLDTGEVLWTAQEYNAEKTVFRESAGRMLPWSWGRDGTAAAFDFRGLENGTRLLLEAEVEGVAENARKEIWSVPITMDLEAPELLETLRFTQEETGKTILQLRFRENFAPAAVILTDGGGTEILTVETLEGSAEENGNIYIKNLDITGLTGKITLVLGDYGANRSAYALNLGGEGNPLGELLGFQRNFTTGKSSWISFARTVSRDEIPVYPALTGEVAAAEYAEGYLYAQLEDGSLWRLPGEALFRDGSVAEMEALGSLERVYPDLTWDRSRNVFWGVYQNPEFGMAELYTIRYLEVEARWQEELVTARENLTGFCLACDGKGTLFLVGTVPGSREAVLFTVREASETGDFLWEMSGRLGLTLRNPQSMTFDEQAGVLLWARLDLEMTKTQCELVEIRPGALTDEGTLKIRVLGQLSGQVLGLMMPDWDA